MALRYEAWDLPTNATTFQRKIADLPVIERQGSGYLELNDGGEGQLALPDDYARLSEIISSTTGSLIRVYDGTTLVHEWTTERVDHDPEAGIVLISGPDIQALPAKAVVYPFDYPDQPTNDPDWHWGNADNLISNPSFENGVNFIANEGFEEGEVEPWWAGAVNGVDATLAIETTTIDTGSFSAKCTPLVSGGGMSTAVTGLQPSHDYTLSVRVNATAGNSIQLGASGPGGIAVVTGTGVAEVDLNTHEYEAQLDVTAAGGWETAQLVFTTAPGQTNTQVSIRNNTGSPALFYVDVVTLSGQGVGMEGWAISPWDANILITASTDVTPVTGTYTARVNAPDGGGIFTEVANVDNGAVYTVSAWGRTDSGTARWTLDVIDELFRRLGQDSIVLTTTFQQFSVQFTVPDDLPGEREVFFALRNDSGGADIAYFDDVEFYRGKAAANPGTILTDLFNDAQSDHSADTRGTVLTWLDISGFDSTNDSGATPWSSTLSFTAFAGDTYLNVLRNLAKLGYEWNITPKASPSPGLTHDLNVYEPDGLGTDYTAAATPAILTGGTTAARSVVERIPNYTAVLSVGGEGAYSEDSDATAATNFGRWETYARYIDTTSTTELATRAAEALADESVNRSAVKVDVVRSPDYPIPLVDYTVGDLLRWQVPGLVSPTNKRVQRIAYRNTEPAEYQVTGSRVFPGEAGLAEAVRVLLNRYDPLKRDRTARNSRPEVVGEGGGAPTLVVAASDASAASKERADFLCDGTDDQDTIQEAIDALGVTSPYQGYRILLTEGTFNIRMAAAAFGAITLQYGTIQGMGKEATYLNITQDPSTANDPVIDIQSTRGTVRDLTIQGGTTTRATGVYFSGYDCRVENCLLATNGYAVQCAADVAMIMGCVVEGDDGIAVASGVNEVYVISNDIQATTAGSAGVELLGNNDRIVIVDNHILAIDGILVAGSSHLDHIYANNVLEATQYGIYWNGAGIVGLVVSGNTINTATGSDAIRLSGGGSIQAGVIKGNVLRTAGAVGIHFAADLPSGRLVIADNFIEQPQQHGIHFETGGANGVSDCLITGNHIYLAGQATTNTYDAILLANDSNRNFITDNVIISDATIKTRNGINISAATCDDNQIGSNDFGTIANFGTAVISDSGTDTQYADATTLAFSQSGTLSIGAGSFKWPMAPGDYMVLDTQGAVGTAPSGGPVTLDANKNGTTMYAVATNPSIASGQTVGSAAKPDYTTLTTNDYITVDVDAANSAADLTAIVRVLPL